MPKKYAVRLAEDERTHLIERIGRGESPAREQTRARILLKADEAEGAPAWTDGRIAEALDVSAGTVAAVRRRFTERGLVGAVERKAPERMYERALDGEQEARLLQIACTTPPEGRSHWSMRLLAGRMVELGYVASLSHETVRQVLKKTSSSPTSAGSG